MFDDRLKNRFFIKVIQTDDCWYWIAGSRGKTGYGAFKIENDTVDAHRVSWMIHFGPIPDGLCVCHKCDNRRCVRPDHLFLGTKKDNNQDMFRKGRNAKMKIGRIAPVRHGDINEYKTFGCRCDLCKRTHRDLMRQYRASQK